MGIIVLIYCAADLLQVISTRIYYNILAVKKADHLNIKTKLALREHLQASQSERVPQSCFYVKVACLSYGAYSSKCDIKSSIRQDQTYRKDI